MTIDRGVETERYQGVVPLEGETLTEAADTYFRQSEQLPTFIRLAVARHYRAGSGSRPWTWRAGGLLVQKLTREGGRVTTSEAALEEEDWTRARALAETVEDHELLDPMLPPDRLLYRLFHEEQVRAYRAIPLESYCSCSRERVEELNDALDWSLPTGDFETVAGLVLATLHRIPLVGEVFRVRRFTITVLEADKRRVLAVRIVPDKKPTTPEV